MSGLSIRNKNQFSFSDLTANLKFVNVIEFGYHSNKTNSGAGSIAIGTETGDINQGTFGIAIGYQAGQNHQNPFGIAIGKNAGQTNQGTNAIALGEQAGQNHQNPFGIAIGTGAGQTNQGTNAIAIGTAAGQTNQHSNSIILNASETPLNSTGSGFFVNPVREEEVGGIDFDLLVYNTITSEITRQVIPYSYGDYKYSVNNMDHDNWLLCDGRSLSIKDYPLLFNAIGHAFGGFGDMFRLPDPRSRVLGAIGRGGGLSNRTIGQKVGSEIHALTIDEMPVHSHEVIDPGHSHSYQYSENVSALASANLGTKTTLENAPTAKSTTGITLGNSGEGQPYDIMQPTIFIGNVFIYADF